MHFFSELPITRINIQIKPCIVLIPRLASLRVRKFSTSVKISEEFGFERGLNRKQKRMLQFQKNKDQEVYFVRLSVVQRHVKILPLEERDNILQYFKSKLFFEFGWDVFIGEAPSPPPLPQPSKNGHNRRNRRAEPWPKKRQTSPSPPPESYQKQLLVVNNQIEYFLDEVKRRSGARIAPIPIEDRIPTKRVKDLDHITRTTTTSEFGKLIAGYGMSYDSSPAVLESAAERAAKREVRMQKVKEHREKVVADARRRLEEQNDAFVSVDIEAYELDNSLVTEIGIAILDLQKPNRTKFDAFHWRVKERIHLKNGRYVSDASEKFEFGKSRILPLDQCRSDIQELLEMYQGRYAFVGHDPSNDIRYLQKINVKIPEDTPVFDTSEIWKLRVGEGKSSSLSTILDEFDISAWNLHNAGNDAYYTLQALLALVK
ncbi:hypothetical protein V1512DRAFT_258811 [Lipomyces arxii]|uniref:uncharacterized protein n=1 Tax=Lipomyces arxii TaxID=56418 RepID=UPI0034CE8C7F